VVVVVFLLVGPGFFAEGTFRVVYVVFLGTAAFLVVVGAAGNFFEVATDFFAKGTALDLAATFSFAVGVLVAAGFTLFTATAGFFTAGLFCNGPMTSAIVLENARAFGFHLFRSTGTGVGSEFDFARSP